MYGKDKFLEIFDKYITREGAEKLKEFLISSDFFSAPASTKFHSAFEGGLCEHSVNTYDRLLYNVQKEYGENWQKFYSHESVAICALLHDLCKISYYKKDFRNVKENGQWVKKEVYVKDEELPYGHGEKSVYIISSFIHLSREEAVAINWHMGGFDTRVKGGDGSISEAYAKFPLAVLLHVSDITATYLDEKRDF